MHATTSCHTAVTLLLAVASAPSASHQEKSLESLAEEARAAAGAPALGCVVQRADEEPEIAVAGVRVAGEDAAVTVTDAWHWGSVTKSMTATLVARLVEKGTVEWDDTIGYHLFDGVPDMNLDLADATFRHLLSHHAGQPRDIPHQRFGQFGQNPEEPIADRLEWVKIALAQRPAGTVGETYSYSNNGYIVAGAMLESATGISWEELMRKEVFRPLGISGAGFGAPPGAAPRGHTTREDGTDRPAPVDADNPGALGPAGRVHMPLADMTRYLAAHARRDPDFLEPESWKILHEAPFTGTYAMGWVVTDEGRSWHNGSNTLWYAEVAIDRSRGTVAAVAINDGSDAAKPAVGELLRRLLRGSEEDPHSTTTRSRRAPAANR